MFAVVSLALLSAVARAALSSDDVKLIESQFAGE
jgi:hypothetical protein